MNLEEATEQSRSNMLGAWTELRGYVAEAVVDGGVIVPVKMLAYMDELKRTAMKPVDDAFAELGIESHKDDT